MKQVRPNIICFLTDRLHLGYLGAYGNSWIGTAAFDRLACESVLFDRAFATSLSLPALYRAFWYGHEPFAADLSAPDEKEPGFFGRLFAKGAAAPVSPLFTALSGAGYRTVLVTDDMETARLGKGLFEKVELFSPAKGIAETAEQSAVFRGLKDAADAASRMARGRAPFFLWIHLKGWGGIWDTPQQLRDEAREDDGDPPPYGGAIPPSFEMPPDADDDPLHAVLETYAAGVRLWDTSLEFFLGMLNRERARRLRQAGFTSYHHNLETARSHFPAICTTHAYDEDLASLAAARAEGLRVCSCGIFGLGESWSQRAELFETLAEAQVDSLAVNFLMPVPGTRLEGRPRLAPWEALRCVALARLTSPSRDVVVCGGRLATLGPVDSWVLAAGANGLMTGDYLTTRGSGFESDQGLLESLGLR